MAALLQRVLNSRKSSVSRTSPQELKHSHVNVVHIKREPPSPLENVSQFVNLLPQFRTDVTLDLQQPCPASDSLLVHMPPGEVTDWVRRDVGHLAQIFRQQLGYSQVHARLEVVTGVLCPRWHADNVRVRCLVTFSGPGSLYLDNRDVTRRMDRESGSSFVHFVKESGAQQAEPGDWIFLKGHLWEGNDGLGAVHRSPAADTAVPRLLLTVDDVIPEECDCC